MTDPAKMTPSQRYENIRDLSENFKRKGFLKNLILKHLQEAIDQARKEGVEQAREDCITQMHIEIQTLKEQSKMSGLQPLESELRRRVDNLRALQPLIDGDSKPSTIYQPSREGLIMDELIQKHISVNPEIHHGEPCFRGTRIQVYIVLGLLQGGVAIEEIVGPDYYPQLTRDHIRAALHFAAQSAKRVEPTPSDDNPLHGPGSGCHCTACETWEA